LVVAASTVVGPKPALIILSADLKPEPPPNTDDVVCVVGLERDLQLTAQAEIHSAAG
jgi:hypothetical protein